MKKLTETISFQIVTSCVNHETVLKQMVSDYNEVPWCELPIMLSCLRALALTHQMGHWVANGDPFYGDHLLFERLYNGIVPEIDKVAEKAVGMGGSALLHPAHQMTHEALMLGIMCPQNTSIPNSGELARRSYEAEMQFIAMLEKLIERLKCCNCWTIGVENMLGEIADHHEENVYLLKQRIVA